MSIGEVLSVLKPEFAEITVSKLRFLEGAGLVSPGRTPAGYRKFSEDDVARLRFVLRAQRDQYLPLRVIRQRLVDLEAAGGLHARGGPQPVAPVRRPAPAAEATEATEAEALPDPAPAAAPAKSQLTREELCKEAGREPTDLAALEAFGLIGAHGDNGGWYSREDVVILRAAGELAAFGLEPRHLRMYKTFADREGALFGQVTAPLLRQHNPDSRRQAQQTLDILSNLCNQLHAAVLRNELDRVVPEAGR
jgi:DNA-binding transcriptional MerR regulator